MGFVLVYDSRYRGGGQGVSRAGSLRLLPITPFIHHYPIRSSFNDVQDERMRMGRPPPPIHPYSIKRVNAWLAIR